jgi:hypothetical protein
MIGNDGAGESGLRPPLGGKVAVHHDIEYALWRDDSIVHLDFVGLGKGRQGRVHQNHAHHRECA